MSLKYEPASEPQGEPVHPAGGGVRARGALGRRQRPRPGIILLTDSVIMLTNSVIMLTNSVIMLTNSIILLTHSVIMLTNSIILLTNGIGS